MNLSQTSPLVGQKHLQVLVWALLGLVLLVLLRTAWLCDDAYISYRCIDNLVSDHGFGYNAGERVQAYTHPLWALLHVPLYMLARNAYLWGYVLSLGTSIVAVLVLAYWQLSRPLQRCAVLVALVCSQAWVDYSTSGLENPLSHLLLVLFCVEWFGPGKGKRRLQTLTAIAALAMLNRMDTILLYAPAVAYSFWQVRSWRAIWWMLVAALPLIGWEIFATIYYGFPVPNTAFAKLNLSLPKTAIYLQGLKYYASTLLRDPFTLVVIVAALALSFWQRKLPQVLLAIGLLLYLLYIVRIGGDFMLGRFFTTGFVLALILLAQAEWRDSRPARWAWSAALGLVLLPSLYLIVRGKDYSHTPIIDSRGITDERAFYYPATGLLHALTGTPMPRGEWVDQGRAYAQGSERLIIDYNMGFKGYYAGPDRFLIDRYALTDPLLARLPNVYRPDWKPGHFLRMLPPGYFDTRQSGENQLRDPRLAELYDHLAIVTQGPLFTTARWREIWAFNTGAYNGLVDRERYHLPLGTQLDWADVPHVLPPDSVACLDPSQVQMRQDSGITLRLPPDRPISQLQLSLCDRCSYLVIFRKGEEIVGTQGIDSQKSGGMMVGVVRCEAAWQAQGIDNIVIQQMESDRICGLGGASSQ